MPNETRIEELMLEGKLLIEKVQDMLKEITLSEMFYAVAFVLFIKKRRNKKNK